MGPGSVKMGDLVQRTFRVCLRFGATQTFIESRNMISSLMPFRGLSWWSRRLLHKLLLILARSAQSTLKLPSWTAPPQAGRCFCSVQDALDIPCHSDTTIPECRASSSQCTCGNYGCADRGGLRGDKHLGGGGILSVVRCALPHVQKG